MLGNEPLAQYNKAYHFMLYPVQNLTNVISPTLHPILSDYQNDAKIIYEKYIRIVKILSLIGVFVTAVCFICPNEIITILYGNQWGDAVICFKFMSLAIWTQMIGGTSGSLFAALNDTKSHFYVSIVNTAIIIFALLLGIKTQSIQTLALYVSMALISHFFISYYILIAKTMKKSFLLFLKALLPDFLILVILCVLTLPITRFIKINNMILALFAKCSVITLVYALLLSILRQWKFFYSFASLKVEKEVLLTVILEL